MEVKPRGRTSFRFVQVAAVLGQGPGLVPVAAVVGRGPGLGESSSLT